MNKDNPRASRSRARVVIAVSAASALLGMTANSARSDDNVLELVRQLQQQVQALTREVESLKQQAAAAHGVTAHAAAEAQRSSSPLAGAGATGTLSPLAAGSPAAAANTPGATRGQTASADSGQAIDTLDPAAVDLAQTPGAPNKQGLDLSGVRLGGYGSVRFEQNSADGERSTFNFRRFVLTADAPVGPNIRAAMELELERFRKLELEQGASAEAGGLSVEQAIEGTDESEITLEQAWVQYDFNTAMRLRAGGILIPLGRFNIDHDDDRWDIARRPLIDRGSPALPGKAAWAELGVGFNGETEIGSHGALDYQLYLVNGVTLSPEVEQVLATRDPKRDKLELEAKFKTQSGTFGNDVKDAKALAGRLAFSPELGHEIAASFYRGRYTPDYLPSESITSLALDGISTWGAWQLEGEYVYSDFGDVDRLAGAFAAAAIDQSSSTPSSASPDFESEIEFEVDSLAERRHGYWLEARYDIRSRWLSESALGQRFADPVLTLIARGEQVWIDGLLSSLDFSGGEITELSKEDHRLDRFTLGAAYRPVPNAALQLAYEYTQVDKGSLGEVTNYLASGDSEAHAILLGTVFGF